MAQKKFTCIVFLTFSLLLGKAGETENGKIIPFSKIFYNIGSNAGQSLLYNKGANVLAGTAATYGLIKTGADWQWNRLAFNNDAIAYAGFPSVIAGGLVPLIVPAALYIKGRNQHNTRLQVTGLALGQAALLGVSISSGIKAFTGRRPPEIFNFDSNAPTSSTDYSNDFKFGFLRRGAFDGWPSGHTMTAFAMAFTLIELYPENNYVKYGSIAYAFFIGTGISLNIHWFSDFVAGALIGYGIGRTVGKSFRGLLGDNELKSNVSFSAGLNYAGLCYSF